VNLLYRAEDHDGNLAGTSRIGLAVSSDGVHFDEFQRLSAPVLYPDRDEFQSLEWQGGIEDPRVVESEDGLYVMTYTSYNGVARLCVATSRDLLTWTKHGPVFAEAHGGAFKDAWTKSGSIVSTVVGERLVATRIKGQYWCVVLPLHLVSPQGSHC
jgi:beta-1,2-mannosidase